MTLAQGLSAAEGREASKSNLQAHETEERNVFDSRTKASRPVTCRSLKTNQTIRLPSAPHLIIVGAQKAGTSAMASFLRMLPDTVGTKRQEAHFWDDSRFTHPRQALKTANLSKEERCRLVMEYHDRWHPQRFYPPSDSSARKIVFEKTPSLLALPSVPQHIRNVLFHTPKILILLRDPIQRAYSHYKMGWKNKPNGRSTYPSFDQLVAEEVELLRTYQRGNEFNQRLPSFSNKTSDWKSEDFGAFLSSSYTRTLVRGCYAPQIRVWLEHFSLDRQLKVISYESLLQNRSGILQEVLSWLGAPPHNLTEQALQAEKGPTVAKSAAEEPGRQLLPLTPTVDSPGRLSNEAAQYLQHFYRPCNGQLAELLGEEWRHIWF